MARIDNLENFLIDVASAIKVKRKDSTNILASEFDTEILKLKTEIINQDKKVTLTNNGKFVVTKDSGYDGMNSVELDIDVTFVPVLQSKSISIVTNGSYRVNKDENFDGLDSVDILVDVQASGDEQHMPFYLLESDDAGNLWCINNYGQLLYIPYSLDVDGNLIVNQDDDDTAVYSINENMELEVVVNG